MRLYTLARQIPGSLLSLFFPRPCAGCGEPLERSDSCLCLTCLVSLPHTGYALMPGNPVEKIFWGRVPVEAACSELHFTRRSAVQSILHEIKYRGNREAGLFMGRMMGRSLEKSPFYRTIAGIVPLPLSADREKRRGYNQAGLLAEGMASILKVPVLGDALVRVEDTDTQTRRNRQERWENVKHAFRSEGRTHLGDQRILLVDDVVTTGATLEAAVSALREGTGCRVCISTLAYANR
jgi:ComF family protein